MTTTAAAGVDLPVLEWLTLNNDSLGRSDVAAPDEVDRPVFVRTHVVACRAERRQGVDGSRLQR